MFKIVTTAIKSPILKKWKNLASYLGVFWYSIQKWRKLKAKFKNLPPLLRHRKASQHRSENLYLGDALPGDP